MIEKTLQGNYGDGVELHHVRMAFSKHINQIGKLRISKIFELLRVLSGMVVGRLKHRAKVLYYFPSGPGLVPVLRDIALLLPTRWMFRKTIFHFRASGLSEYYPQLPAILRPLFRAVYFGADIGVRLSELAPEDPRNLKAKLEYVVPNGIEDAHLEYQTACEGMDESQKRDVLHVTYVGILSEGKGIRYLLEACTLLAKNGNLFVANLVGEFESEDFENYVREYCAKNHLENKLVFHGVLTGCEKYSVLSNSDIFCFPSFFESETTPVAVLEALAFGLPVVATLWRAIPSIINDEVEGFLVPIRDAAAIAKNLELLIRNPAVRKVMARRARIRYLEEFTIDIYYRNMRRVFEASGSA